MSDDLQFENSLDIPLKEILPIIQNRIVTGTTYFGIPALKSPIDSWIYQEILFEIKPDIIVEIGNMYGGSALFLAHICDLIGSGKVLGLDLSHANIHELVKKHPRITLIEGDACNNLEQVKARICQNDKVLIIEDSSHTYENTLNVLRLYSSIVTRGSYFIVEDSICHHGLDVGPDPGPFEAIEAFLKECDDFEIDRSKEPFLITWNPKGYLRKIN
jgi:cephalosporin hydroxylase